MLDLDKKHCKLGVINNRIEMHGDKEVTAFDIPFTLLLDPKELNELLGDPYKHRALFDTKGDVATPLFPEFTEFTMKNDLEGATVALRLSPTYEIEFKDTTLKGLTLAPIHGGETELNGKLQVTPQTKHITRLLDAQNTEIQITVADAKIAEKKKRKQRELPLGPDPNADQDGEGDGTTTPLNGSHIAGGAAERDTTHIHWQQGENGERGNGPRCDMPADCVEVDPPQGSKSEREQFDVELGQTSPEITGDGSGTALPPTDGNEEFAQGVAKALGAHKKRGSAIDGRVRNRDRQAGKH
jgi:hypothetical protein